MIDILQIDTLLNIQFSVIHMNNWEVNIVLILD